LSNTGILNAEETDELIDALIRQHEPAYIEKISALLLAGKSPRRIIDAIQLAAARVVLETEGPNNFSMPQHTYEYCNTLGWFYDNFEHPQRLKLLYVAGSMVNQAAWNQRNSGWPKSDPISAPSGADRMSGSQIIERLEAALAALDPSASGAWTKAYLDSGEDRSTLVQRLALMARGSATTRTTKRSRNASWRITPRTDAATATNCCSPARTSRPPIGNTATASRRAAVSARRWAWPNCSNCGRGVPRPLPRGFG